MRYYLLNFFLGRVGAAAAIDLLCMALAAGLTWLTLGPEIAPRSYALGAASAAAGSFALLYYTDAYSLRALGSGRRTLSSLVGFLGLATGALLFTHVAFQLPSPPVLAVGAHAAALGFPLLLVGRLGFRALCARPAWTRRILIVGTSDLGMAIARAVGERPNLGAEVAGFLSDCPEDETAAIEGVAVLGRVHELEKVLERQRITHVVVASKKRDEHFPADALLATKMTGTRVEAGVSFYERVTGRIYIRELRPSFLIFGEGFRTVLGSDAVKRALDCTAAAVGLVLAVPLLALAVPAIRIDSPGPVFYTQTRLGRGGKPFRVRKLRSMFYEAEEGSGAMWTSDDDERVTRVGRFLRRTRIDEIPQLWNVLRGQMSLVGPRPERPEFQDELASRYPYFRLRTAVRPGLTGWAQIRQGYVNNVDAFEDKLALDLYYVKHRSLSMDLLILWHTIRTVLLMRGF